MFRFTLEHPITPASLTWRPRPQGGYWNHGHGQIEPFTHPALEHQLVLGPDSHGFIVNRERRRGVLSASPMYRAPDTASYARLRAQSAAWPLGFILVDLDPGAVRITASPWGVAPIHLTTTGGGALYGSWDLLDLIGHIGVELDPVEAVRFLTYSPVYSKRTLLAGVQTVTERATATFTRSPGTAGRVRIDYPEPGLHALPRELRQGADPVAAFEDLMAAVIDQWDFHPDTAVADLSGGMDSTNVALSLAQLHPGQVATGAMLLTGPQGEQQIRRRALLRQSGFAADHRLPMAAHLPFAPGGPRAVGARFHPQEGPYAEARNLLLDRYAAAGASVVFTGLGGDEAMKVRADELAAPTPQPGPLSVDHNDVPVYLGAHARRLLAARYDDAAPLGPALWSILDCFAALYPHYMRRGLWPINPLAAPQFVRLTESLPAPWRAGKRLLRDRLTRRGFSREVTHPPLQENFQHILDLAMRRHGVALLESLLDDRSWLVAEGYLDEGELRRACRCFAATGQRTYEIYRPLILEAGLRSLTQPKSPRSAPQDPAAMQRAGT
ncbi:hypothetical protein [Actinomadura macra]|uniref:hypothetical protein n=1 Tax=Actinomadura macra TaxID=46164 RepID=UPI000830EA89|nr:hypothetical protein [Actinomadura macra]